MLPRSRPTLWLVIGGLLAALAGCAGTANPSPSPSPTHTHATGPEHITPLVGDGTRATEFDYTLDRLSLPERAGVPGKVSFRISLDGRAVRDYVTQQTKNLHLYVVRTDLSVFRHLHPSIDSAGIWSAPVTLPQGGDYRVIAEFAARVDAVSGEAVMLGRTGLVPNGRSSTTPAALQPDSVTADIEGPLQLGPDGRLTVVIRHADGGPVQLGSYLGTFGHVTAFERTSGRVAHLHPLGEPSVGSDGTRLTFHTEIMTPGDFLAFVQVRVDGFLHTIAVPVKAG